MTYRRSRTQLIVRRSDSFAQQTVTSNLFLDFANMDFSLGIATIAKGLGGYNAGKHFLEN